MFNKSTKTSKYCMTEEYKQKTNQIKALHVSLLTKFKTEFRNAIAEGSDKNITIPTVKTSYQQWLQHIDKRYIRAKLDNFSKNIKDKIKDYDLTKTSFFIFGSAGVGKTHLATAILKEYCLRQIDLYNPTRLDEEIHTETILEHINPIKDVIIPPLYIDVGIINFQALACSIKSSFSGSGSELKHESMEELVASVTNGYFRIVDDLGGKASETVVDALLLITEQRNNTLPTIYTSNYNPDQITDVYGDRVVSRLSDCEKIFLNGEDRRGSITHG